VREEELQPQQNGHAITGRVARGEFRQHRQRPARLTGSAGRKPNVNFAKLARLTRPRRLHAERTPSEALVMNMKGNDRQRGARVQPAALGEEVGTGLNRREDQP
jgi:hypothetical protein